MQRKNRVLKYSAKNRGGFALIMAMAVLVVLTTIMAYTLSVSSKTTKQTLDLYLYEQSLLLSKSATEYALLYISQNGCIDNLNFTKDPFEDDDSNGIFTINIDMEYVFTNSSGCSDYINNLETNESNGSVLMDVSVFVNDSNITSEPIRFFRRTIQKL